MDTELADLRDKLAAIDRDILDLVGRRTRLASEIGRVKHRLGRPTRDFRQERNVIERARRVAAKLDVPSDLAEELMLTLIRSALTVQEKQGITSGESGLGKTALVIGGSGKMGRWFARFLVSMGFDITLADPVAAGEEFRQFRDWKEAGREHDVVVIATPLAVTNTILEEMAEDPPPGLVFDVGSLKSPLREGLRKLAAAGGKVTSIHPMFGPDTELLSGRHVIFVDCGHAGALKDARELFGSTLAVHVEMDLESHDRLIAFVLGLSHATNIAFFTALVESGEKAPRLAELSSTTFDEQLRVASKVSRESPELYFEIQSLNDYGTESLSALLYAVERLRSVVRAGDAEGFAALMKRGREYLSARD